MSTIFCQKNHWCKLRLMMTFMEVKGHQRSNVKLVLWLPYLVKRSAHASWEWWPLWRSEVKWGKLCAMATIFGLKKRWCKLRMMMTFMEVIGQQRSNSKLCYIATKLGQINRWCKFRMMGTFMEVKGQQRSNIVNNDLWLPNLVRRFADTSWGWLWPSQRWKISKGYYNKQFSIATKLGRKSSWCKFRMTVTFMEVKCHQRSNTVNNIYTTYMIFGE